MSNTSLLTTTTAEIADLHQFFQDWFNGTLPHTEQAFARFTNVMAADFHIVWPDGRLLNLPPLTTALYDRHQSHPADTPIRIWIENVTLRHTTAETVLATYEEWQQIHPDPAYVRLSTVLFQRQSHNNRLPHGLLWQHVHETWLTPPANREQTT